jgi:lysophospholipase L1-like esterase
MMQFGRLMLWLLLFVASASAQAVTTPTVRFAEAIEAYERADRETPPPTGSILFVGSSIFRLWKGLTEQMSPLPVFNRAFGGSRTHEILAYTDRIVLPYQPRVIVYYCGSNDINASVPPGRIAGNFGEFVDRVRLELPETRIIFVSINKAPQKKEKWAEVDEANRLVKEYCARHKGLRYVDVNPVLFDRNGQPRTELYLPDNLHFRDPAYTELAKIIKPAVASAWKEARSGQGNRIMRIPGK